MAKSDGQSRFDARREKCAPPVRELLDFMMQAAANAGPNVKSPPTPELKGGGIKYRNAVRQFCAFHPKYSTHVYVWVHGANRDAIVAEGFKPSRQDGWYKIATMPEAVRFIKWILRAHDAPKL